MARALILIALVGVWPSKACAAEEGRKYDFHISAETLASAAGALAAQSGLELLYPYELEAIADIKPVHGRYTVIQALTKMFEGTGLVGDVTPAGVITVTKHSPGSTQGSENMKVSQSSVVSSRAAKKRPLRAGLLAGTATVATASGFLAPAVGFAQEAMIEEITVTARKRDERMIDIPLSVQAFTSNDLRAAGIDDLEDLTLFSPGLDFNSQSSSTFAGRYLPAIRFRGLTTQSALPSNQVGSLFVDGVFVLGGAQSIGFEDVERVEVIRGPQAAYFGRSTFGGAVNYVTADPAEEFQGKVSAEFSPNHGSHRAALTVEGPLFGDALSGRITASTFENAAYLTANDGGGLGQETTDAVHATLLYTPSSTLEFKFRGSLIEDEDWAPATTQLQFSQRSNCLAGTPLSVLDQFGTSRDVTLQGDYWCGALPEDVTVTANTRFSVFEERDGLAAADLRDVFVNNSLGTPGVEDAPFLDHFGLRRQTFRLSASMDYDYSDAISIAGNIAYNEQDVRRIADLDYTDAESVYSAPPNSFEDYSAEIRASFDNGGRLRFLGGINYYEQTINAAFTNALEATNELLIDVFDPPLAIRVVGSQNSGNDSDKIETFGVFGAVEYDVLDNFTATLEGRWQNDEVTSFGGQFIDQGDASSLTSKKFLPRAILSYKPIDDMTAYFSYSEGTLPGQFNATFLALSPADQAVVQQEFPSLSGSIEPEELKSYEVGLKQTLWGGDVSYSVAVYAMDWENMKSSLSFLPPGATGLQGALIAGSSTINGLELEASWRATDNLFLSATANYTNAEYEDFVVGGLNQLFGLSAADGYRVDGNTLPQTPARSASFSATYTGQLNADWGWYTRGDVLYQGKAYTDQTNLNYVDAYTITNLRFGADNGDMSFELYINNLFDETGWVSGATGLDLGNVPVLFSTLNTTRGATVTAMRNREMGLRANFSF